MTAEDPTASRVTVLIPSYRSRAFLAATLRSVRDQSFTRFRVVVAVEPAEEEPDEDLIRRFTADPRFSFGRNAVVLGWAGNVAGLLANVDTELFAILPHDDLWEPDYLAELVAALDRDEGASVAYADMELFGAKAKRRITELDNASLGKRLLSFHLAGADGHAWRGVIRSRFLAEGLRFPKNRFQSFAVECEWTQQLLCRGRGIRVPQTLYRKRTAGLPEASVSARWRERLDPSERRAALEAHRDAMLRGIPLLAAHDVPREVVVLACEVAMLRRAVALRLHEGGLPPAQSDRAEVVRATVARLDDRYGRPILAMLDGVLAKVEAKREAAVGRPAESGPRTTP